MLLFGATSMVGWSIVQLGKEAIAPFCNPFTRAEPCRSWRRIRLEDEDAIAAVLRERPPLVIHCGGICDVDKCEQEPRFAQTINVDSIAALLRHLPAETRLVYCSSDHVFGAGPGPFDETSTPQPISEYGRTRVAAETLIQEHRPRGLIIRCGLPVGPSIEGKTGHLDWLRYRHSRRLPMTVVEDEVRSAVWSHKLAERIWGLARSNVTGIRHVAATRAVSRVELANYLNERYEIGARFDVSRRVEQAVPHLGNVALSTRFEDELAQPLAAVVPL